MGTYGDKQFKCTICGRVFKYHQHAIREDNNGEGLFMICPNDRGVAFEKHPIDNSKKIEELTTEKEELEAKLVKIQEAERQVKERAEAYVGAHSLYSKKLEQGNTATARLEKEVGLHKEGLAKTQQEITELEKQIKELEEKLAEDSWDDTEGWGNENTKLELKKKDLERELANKKTEEETWGDKISKVEQRIVQFKKGIKDFLDELNKKGKSLGYEGKESADLVAAKRELGLAESGQLYPEKEKTEKQIDDLHNEIQKLKRGRGE